MAKPWMNRLMMTGRKRGFERACIPSDVPFYGRTPTVPVLKGEPVGKVLKKKRRKKKRYLPDLTAEQPKGVVYVR